MMSQKPTAVKTEIDTIEISDDCLTGRAGMSGFSRYLRTIGIANILTRIFSFLKKSKEGVGLRSLFHQLLCYFFRRNEFSPYQIRPAEKGLRLRCGYRNTG